jgi:hypothetical protein
MVSLARDLRRDLETKAREARVLAEVGARKALERLGVHLSASPGYLTDQEKKLRAKLRAHAKRLGDRRHSDGSQDIDRLVPEVAYEHWHRMLFARFLAENDLLLDDGLALTLADVQELAREQGKDWLDLATGYAQRMLPEIFRTEDPALALTLPPETRSALEDRLKALPPAVFQADDSLGWVYQFWQADENEEINNSQQPVGADEIPAMTQFFTEDYMVLFLLHNTLGAWWAGKVLSANPALAAGAMDEVELRAACALPGVEWTYLRFVRKTREDSSEGGWRPAADPFPDWPKDAKDITFLDPCMGSGHFLVFALPILVALRMVEEGLNRKDAVLSVLRDNLHGLEIDPRCTQIAAFNLAFAAWRLIGAYANLPALHLACSGLAIGMQKQEWMKLADKVAQVADPGAKSDLMGTETTVLNAETDSRIRTGLSRMYDLFEKAPVLGSLIDPRRAGGDLFAAGWDLLEPILKQALADGSDELTEIAVAAQGLAKAAELLANRYVLVMTNVPYLGRKRFDTMLSEHASTSFKRSSADLATMSVERGMELTTTHGLFAFVFKEEFLFLKTHRKFREMILKEGLISFLIALGEDAWTSFGNRGPLAVLGAMSTGSYSGDPSHVLLNLRSKVGINEKIEALKKTKFVEIKQSSHAADPDARITFDVRSGSESLNSYSRFGKGSTTGDGERFIRFFWEMDKLRPNNLPWLNSPRPNDPWSGRTSVSICNLRDPSLLEQNGCRIHGQDVWGLNGAAVNKSRYMNFFWYCGEVFDDNVGVVVPYEQAHRAAVSAYLESNEYRTEVRKLDQAVKVTAATLTKVPFDLAHWQKVAAERYPNGLPKPHSDDPTQWLFNGHPVGSNDPLQVAVARLLGYRWPRQTGSSFMDCPAITEPDGLESYADNDGIVCLSSVKGEAAAAERLSALLASAYGADWSPHRLTAMLSAASDGKARDLNAYLRDHFFKRHVELFQNRPFIWHVWDGRQDGFHALVNYHKLAAPNGEGRRTLEKLVYSYLREWIDRCRTEVKAAAEGAEGRLAAAEHLRGRLEAILEGEPPYDIFVRWKPLHRQAVGWEPDVNDGVRVNIRPFLTTRPLDARGATACILRVPPRIKWEKDRGTEPMRPKDEYPWFWDWDGKTPNFPGGAQFDGDRWNDLHYDNDTKRAARERKGNEE